jgi:hypothetical protein
MHFYLPATRAGGHTESEMVKMMSLTLLDSWHMSIAPNVASSWLSRIFKFRMCVGPPSWSLDSKSERKCHFGMGSNQPSSFCFRYPTICDRTKNMDNSPFPPNQSDYIQRVIYSNSQAPTLHTIWMAPNIWGGSKNPEFSVGLHFMQMQTRDLGKEGAQAFFCK